MDPAIHAAAPNRRRPGGVGWRSPGYAGRFVASLLGLGLLATPALAQEVIRPAAAIRVVEARDGHSGRLARQVAPDPTPAEVLRVQVELARAGYDPGVRSGVLDPATRRALRRFQIDRGLALCGCASYETVVALGIRVEVLDGGEVVDGFEDHRHPIVVILRDGPGGVSIGGVGGGVVVGHAPAVGAATRKEPPDDRGRPRSGVGVREPIPPPPARTGARIR